MKVENHHDHPHPNRSKNALKLAIAATLFILIVETAGGWWTNSLALLSDAAHVFMDLLSFALTLSAILIAERPISDTRTFGWHRLEVMAAVLNAVTVLVMAVLIFVHGARRLSAPEQILSRPMLVIALLGLAVNLIVVWKLHPHATDDLNVRSAFLHAVGDSGASLAVVMGGVWVWLTGQHAADAIAAMAVAGLILFSAGDILRDSIHILLEGAPKGLDRNTAVRSIEEIAGAQSVKDLHVWNLCSHICALSVHLVLPAERMSEQQNILAKIHKVLEEDLKIAHTTIQIESSEWQERRN